MERLFCCGHRLCPRCMPLLAGETRERVRGAFRAVMNESLKALDVTLTVENCEWSELPVMLPKLQAAFGKMLSFAALKKAVVGGVRAIEVTEGRDGLAHPHIHAVLLVPSIYLPSHDAWIAHGDRFEAVGAVRGVRAPWQPVQLVAGWVSLWQRALGVDYRPGVYVKLAGRGRQVDQAVGHALKYALKPPVKMTADGRAGALDGEALAWLSLAIEGRRLVECYGLVRAELRDEDPEQMPDEIDEKEEARPMPAVVTCRRWCRVDGVSHYVIHRVICGARDWDEVRDELLDVWPRSFYEELHRGERQTAEQQAADRREWHQRAIDIDRQQQQERERRAAADATARRLTPADHAYLAAVGRRDR
ncbi:MAG: protein rep [Alphaproteobacteria bacterium]|nr:protein rep [Alphaproteobacteria bacterium]